MQRRYAVWLLGLVTAAGIVLVAALPRIPQDPAYHLFADSRTMGGVPNFWNVFSNLGFLPVALFGLAQLRCFSVPALRSAYITFCVGAFAVGFGSSWYHLDPSIPSLVWDRLPMSVAFMALFAMVVADRISQPLGAAMLWPAVAAGVGSVLYWYWTELQGAGDLRPYGVVQFLPMLLMPVMLLALPGSRGVATWLWFTFAAYILAKLAEHYDAPVFHALGMSGHSIKHVASSLAVLFAIFALLRFEPRREARQVS